MIISLIVVAFVIAFIILTPWVLKHWATPHSNTDAYGSFGDQFGFTNALFSGLALAGVIVAILMQSEELRLQRRELELTRNVLRQQSKQLNRQAKASEQQVFESTFFQLLSLHLDLVSSISIRRPGGDILHGRRALSHVASLVSNAIPRSKHTASPHCTPSDSLLNKRRAVINTAYMQIFDSRLSNIIGHYFRNLYVIMRYVDDSYIQDKSTYIRLLRAHISEAEALILFYNCASDVGWDKFMPIASKYHIFDNLRKDILASPLDEHLTTSRLSSRVVTRSIEEELG
jgi:hypothetical protein